MSLEIFFGLNGILGLQSCVGSPPPPLPVLHRAAPGSDCRRMARMLMLSLVGLERPSQRASKSPPSEPPSRRRLWRQRSSRCPRGSRLALGRRPVKNSRDGVLESELDLDRERDSSWSRDDRKVRKNLLPQSTTSPSEESNNLKESRFLDGLLLHTFNHPSAEKLL